jgi:hypothetical protein
VSGYRTLGLLAILVGQLEEISVEADDFSQNHTA